MKLNCGVTIVNRFATNIGIKCDQKFKNAVLAVMKPPKNEVIYLLLITSKNKTGTKYKVSFLFEPLNLKLSDWFLIIL